MKFIGFLLPLLLIGLSFYSIPKGIEKKINKAIVETFDATDHSLKSVKVQDDISETLPSVFTEENFFRIEKANLTIGYAYLGEASSKTDTFIYLVLLNKNLEVLNTRVLVYREDYGGEIGSRRWLKQFEGKTPNDELTYGDNIMAISGATISVKSMTNAMDNLLTSLRILNIKNIL